MTNLPTGTVTFLFTDIEGSTRLLEARPEAYRAALAWHDAIIRGAVAAHGGIIFQTRGDGLCAAFASPVEAARAALDAQCALRDEAWVDAGPLKSRMSLHTGEVECQDGEYFGQPLHRCARLMDSAHGGQVVLSAAAATLAGESLPPGAGLKDLGEHRLRDIARPERIYQLTLDGLPSDFPPLRTLTLIPNNLPTQVTAFIGREQQIQSVRDMLLRPDTRLVTLTGPGGTGKTRLALQVAADLAGTFADGIYFVPLASVTDPDLVPFSIAQALGVREAAGRSIVALLTDTLRQKQLLLMLDNFEQVVDAAPIVAELLLAAPQLRLLVTSRAALRLYGEREYPVPPLDLPDRRSETSATHVAQFEAVRLFVDRASAARPDFALDDGNAADVAEICQRLDGLPLAIELAAARIRALTPGAMLQRMERRRPLLTGGARDLPARQRTLRDTIAWSYDLLEPDEMTLFRRLAVFRGCTLESAETVCAGEPTRPGATTIALPPLGLDVLDGIESLAEKSLLRREEAPDGQPWYRMLETVREYALERLEECGEADVVHRRHALAAVRFAESAEDDIYGPEQALWFARVDQEHDNLRAALDWCEERGYAEPALRICVALWWFWSRHGHVQEGRERLASVLARFPLGPSSQRVELRAKALYGLGLLASSQGDFRAARAALEEGLSLRRAVGNAIGVLNSLEGLGTILCFGGAYDAARQYLEEALDLARRLGQDLHYASALNTLGNVYYELGEFEIARRYFAESHLFLKDDPEHSGSIFSLAAVALAQGNLDEAEALMAEALDRYRQIGNPRVEALGLATLGGVAIARGEYVRAYVYLRDSVAIQRQLGDAVTVAQVLDRFVELAVAQGRAEGALRVAGASTALRERAGTPRQQGGRDRLERLLAPARQAQDSQVAEAAWQAGRALDLDDAIAAALAITEPGQPSDTPASATPAGAGASPLSRREQEVATLIARGLTNRQIANELVITEGTAANHVKHILNKLEFSSRAQVAVWAAERGLRRP